MRNDNTFYIIEVTKKTYTDPLGKKLQSPDLCMNNSSTAPTNQPVREILCVSMSKFRSCMRMNKNPNLCVDEQTDRKEQTDHRDPA